MGIRGLTKALRDLPVGTQVALLGKEVVIDGPALIHRLWELLMKDQGIANVILEQVSYSELGESVVRWLDELRSQGVHVRKIYFDGYLPPFKWDTRKERLMQQTTKVQSLSSNHRGGVKLGHGKSSRRKKDRNTSVQESTETSTNHEPGATGHLSSLQFSKRTKDHLDGLPKHAFMVPAVIESLRHSHWSHIVQVVPGEADAFCAQDVRHNGGLLLTADSDLIIQDLGPEGYVVFLWNLFDLVGTDPMDAAKDVSAQEVEEDQALGPAGTRVPLSALAYSRSEIERHLAIEGIGGLPRLVFEWKQDGGSLQQAQARLTKNANVAIDQKAFDAFLQEHRSVEYIPKAHAVVGMLSSLDPRISEFVIQSLNVEAVKVESVPGRASQQSAAGPRGPEELSIFLPTMIEDTSSKSCWEYSQTTRQLAYGLAQSFAHRQRESVIEYRLLYSLSGGRKIDMLPSDTIQQWCEMLVTTLDQIGSRQLSAVTNAKWLAFALFQEIQLSNAKGTKSTATKLVKEYLSRGIALVNYSWHHIHLGAIIQAAQYSLRILKQILDVKATLVPEPMTASQESLRGHLETLPPITEWPSASTLAKDLFAFGKAGGLALVSRILGVPEPRPNDSSAKPKKRARDPSKTEKGELPQKVAKSSRSSNPFEALEMASE
ncbi:DNA replication initiation factor cdc45 [Seiridium cupressi]